MRKASISSTQSKLNAQLQDYCLETAYPPPRSEKVIVILATILILIFPVMILFCFRVVSLYKRAVIFRLGRLREGSPAGPGVIWMVPCTDAVILIDLRTQSVHLAPQEIITKDSVTITVEAIIYFHVAKPLSCLLRVQSYKQATEYLAISVLRMNLGEFELSELLTTRDEVTRATRKQIHKGASEWGVEIERIEIKYISLPNELQKAMAAAAEGSRFAYAMVIEAEGEIKAAENLREAARVMEHNPDTMHLRYLQTILKVATNNQCTIMFPMPLNVPDIRTDIVAGGSAPSGSPSPRRKEEQQQQQQQQIKKNIVNIEQ